DEQRNADRLLARSGRTAPGGAEVEQLPSSAGPRGLAQLGDALLVELPFAFRTDDDGAEGNGGVADLKGGTHGSTFVEGGGDGIMPRSEALPHEFTALSIAIAALHDDTRRR